MKKIVLSEQQVKKLMDNVINEQVPATRALEYTMNDGRYYQTCEFDVPAGHDNMVKYQNGEIDDFYDGKGVISFLLEIDHQTYGIQNILIKDIKFPPTIDVTIRYYPEGHSSEDEDWHKVRKEEKIKLPINWKNTKLYKWDDGKHIKHLGISDKISVDVKPDGNGGLIGYVVEVDVREFHGKEDED
jgi:hypothetical protein